MFSYLTENPSYLEYLQENASYTIINKNAKKGIYKYIDDSDTIVFEKRD
ncbi:MAG: hypothetical protein K0U54_02955 [Bacteroidetes bacterium]|nr:hypothetical protein [Bacteroidota bacterium]